MIFVNIYYRYELYILNSIGIDAYRHGNERGELKSNMFVYVTVVT